MALLALSVSAGCVATAVHVDHGLRDGSASEAEVVAEAATQLGAAFRAERVDVTPGPNLEARARRARHDVLPSDALLGHTADDQAETMLLNLLRGAGLEGLGAMRRDRRPILSLRRWETHRLCMELGLTVVDDESNHDPAFRRNRVRQELVPLLDDIAQRDVTPVLARQAEHLRETADEIDLRANALDPTDARALDDASPVLARQAVRTWLRGCSEEHHPPNAAAVDRVLAVAAGTIKATEIGGGWRVERHHQRLVLVPPAHLLG
jgi:tRNA(Ile)-lysidine synthase